MFHYEIALSKLSFLFEFLQNIFNVLLVFDTCQLNMPTFLEVDHIMFHIDRAL